MKQAILLVLLGMTACAASGPQYSAINKDIVTASDNKAKIVIYRMKEFYGSANTYWVEMNGKQFCDIHDGSFAIYETTPTTVNLATSTFGVVGTSRLSVKLAPRETVYVRFEQKDSRIASGLFGGVIGQAINEGVSDSPGPINLTVVPRSVAESEMYSFRHEVDCQ